MAAEVIGHQLAVIKEEIDRKYGDQFKSMLSSLDDTDIRNRLRQNETVLEKIQRIFERLAT